MRQEIRFAAPLPPDVPAPPAWLGGGVRWPDGVYRPPGEPPDGWVERETGHVLPKRGEPSFPYPARLRTLALPAGLALSAAALALVRRGRRR